MENILKLVGLWNIVLFTIATSILVKKAHLNIKKHPFSDLGENKRLGTLFNTLLVIFGINQTIFAAIICSNLENPKNLLLLAQFLIGGVALCLAGVFTDKKHGSLHALVSSVSAVLVVFGVVALSFELLGRNPLAAISVILAAILIPVSYLLRKRLPGAEWEIILFSGVFVWNIVLTLPLIF